MTRNPSKGYVAKRRNSPLPAQNGLDICYCGCKYWENNRCIDCGEHVEHARKRYVP